MINNENRGWVRIYRKILHSKVWTCGDAYVFKVWIWCILKASPFETTVDGITIHPGEFITTKFDGSEECHIALNLFSEKLKKLKSWGNISTRPCGQFTVITLCNWAKYNPPTQHIKKKNWKTMPEGKGKYAAYLCSRSWNIKKEAVKKRAKGLCERCESRPLDAVHHLTYERKYHENLEDLQAICNTCHGYTHAKDGEAE